MSVFVSATTPCPRPSSSQIARCSRVCGITPSSAATTSSTRSMPVAPATIVRTSPSWPGTSTTERRRPPARSSGAKPSSMVMPRAFSSGRRSVSMPVSARTSARLAVVDVTRGAEHESRDFARLRLTARTASRRLRRISAVQCDRTRCRAAGPSGSRSLPSACWWFSSSAISAREIATPVPLSVCTSSLRLPPSRLKRIRRRRAW